MVGDPLVYHDAISGQPQKIKLELNNTLNIQSFQFFSQVFNVSSSEKFDNHCISVTKNNTLRSRSKINTKQPKEKRLMMRLENWFAGLV